MKDKLIRSVVEGQFDDIRKMINQLQTECSVYSPEEQLNYIKPLRYMIFEALGDLYSKKHERVDFGTEFLSIIKSEE